MSDKICANYGLNVWAKNVCPKTKMTKMLSLKLFIFFEKSNFKYQLLLLA